MLTLAIDTATTVAAVALLDGSRVLCQSSQSSRNHSRTLLHEVDRLVELAGATPGQLEAIVVDIGPGSFTGVRVGLALAKTLAFSLNIRLAGVSSLRVLAENGSGFTGKRICPAIDALKNEVYSAGFRGPEQWQEEAARDPSDWARALGDSGEPCLILGSGALKYREQFHAILGDVVPDQESLHCIQPESLARVAAEVIQRGQADDPRSLEPMYCRLSEAERVRSKRLST